MAPDKERHCGKLEGREAEGRSPGPKLGCLVLALSRGIKLTLVVCPETDTHHMKAVSQ